MSQVKHSFFPRSLFHMDEWFKKPLAGELSTMDLYDPFDDLDMLTGGNFFWFNKPLASALPIMPRVPRKYRITLECAGFRPESIRTEVKGHKLSISGSEKAQHTGEDFTNKEFKKTYDLPENSEVEKLTSFMGTNGIMVVDVPLKLDDKEKLGMSDMFPRITSNPDGTKAVLVKFNLPLNVDPLKITLNVKDRDLIMRAEDKVEKPDYQSNYYIYQRTTLPENTDIDHLKCVNENNQVVVTAPLNLDSTKPVRSIPIELMTRQQA